MPITVTCACGKSFETMVQLARHTAQCPECGGKLRIPGVARQGDDVRRRQAYSAMAAGAAAPRSAAPNRKDYKRTAVVGFAAGAVLLIGVAIAVLFLGPGKPKNVTPHPQSSADAKIPGGAAPIPDGASPPALSVIHESVASLFLELGPQEGRFSVPPASPAEDKEMPHRQLCVFKGHTDWVTSVAFVSNHRIASASRDGTIRIWDIATQRELALCRGHSGGVDSLAVSSDGRHLLSGGVDGTVRLWNPDTGEEVRQLEGALGPVYSVAFLPGGRHALAGDTEYVRDANGQILRRNKKPIMCVRLWEIASGKELRRYEGNSGVITSIAVSWDGKHIVSGNTAGGLVRWSIDSPHGNADWTHRHLVLASAFTLDGKLCTCALDGEIRVESPFKGGVKTSPKNKREVFAMAFSRHGRHAVTSTFDGLLHILNLETGTQVHELKGHGDWVGALAISDDGRQIASGGGGRDTTVRLWGQ